MDTDRMKRIACEGLVGGLLSSALSGLLLVVASRRQTGSPYAGINAVSHWLWKDRAFHRDRPSARYTATGYLIHHLASTFWAAGHAVLRPSGSARQPARALSGGLATAAVACFVDYRMTPKRLQPGFEQRLSTPALTGIYVLFGVGIALGAWLSDNHGSRNRKG